MSRQPRGRAAAQAASPCLFAACPPAACAPAAAPCHMQHDLPTVSPPAHDMHDRRQMHRTPPILCLIAAPNRRVPVCTGVAAPLPCPALPSLPCKYSVAALHVTLRWHEAGAGTCSAQQRPQQGKGVEEARTRAKAPAARGASGARRVPRRPASGSRVVGERHAGTSHIARLQYASISQHLVLACDLWHMCRGRPGACTGCRIRCSELCGLHCRRRCRR